jgi:hypothetical protein
MKAPPKHNKNGILTSHEIVARAFSTVQANALNCMERIAQTIADRYFPEQPFHDAAQDMYMFQLTTVHKIRNMEELRQYCDLAKNGQVGDTYLTEALSECADFM